MSVYKQMRVLLCFDLPMEEKDEKREYVQFRKHIIKNGYIMIQYSLYMKYINTQSKFEQEYKRILKIVPKGGNVRMFYLTEKQYSEMKYLSGSRTTNEKYNNGERYIKI